MVVCIFGNLSPSVFGGCFFVVVWNVTIFDLESKAFFWWMTWKRNRQEISCCCTLYRSSMCSWQSTSPPGVIVTTTRRNFDCWPSVEEDSLTSNFFVFVFWIRFNLDQVSTGFYRRPTPETSVFSLTLSGQQEYRLGSGTNRITVDCATHTIKRRADGDHTICCLILWTFCNGSLHIRVGETVGREEKEGGEFRRCWQIKISPTAKWLARLQRVSG